MTVLPKEEATDIVGKLSSEADRLSGGLARHIDGFDAIWIRQAVTEITNLRRQLEEARERNLLANNRADNAEADAAKARENALEDAVDAVYRVWENGIGRVEVAEAIRALIAPQGKES